MLNKVMLIGRLGRDPELRFTQNGVAVTRMSIACERRWRDDQGEQHKEVEWVNVVAWQQLAEACNEYLQKGRLVYIEGRLQTRDWEDESGVKHSQTVIVAEEVKFIDRDAKRTKAEVEEVEQ